MAAKYILKKIADPDNHFDLETVTIEIETEMYSDLLGAMGNFMRACGFLLEGKLGELEEEEDEWPMEGLGVADEDLEEAEEEGEVL